MKEYELNPITKTDYPDPDVIRVGDVYYMASTTMHFFPGCAILRSYDLVNWEIASYVFDVLDDSPAERLEQECANYGKGMWAPTFRYHNGRFYVAFVSHGTDFTYLFTADDVCGEWKKSAISGYYHDLSLLFDDDRVFITYGNRDIYLLELKPDLSGPLEGGVNKLIVSDKTDSILGYEGSHFYKINGKYYVFLINWPKDTGIRTESCFVSETVDGEYKGGVVFSCTRGFRNSGVAQGGIVDTPNGKWFSIMFQDSGAVGRVPVLCPVKFVKDFPVFGVNGKLPVKFEVASSRPYYRYEDLFTSDDFKSGLKKQWQWNHIPDNNLWTMDENGFSITTDKLSVNVTHAKNTLTQRMMFPKCEAEVTVDASLMNEGDVAGLVALQSLYGYIGIYKSGGCLYLITVEKTETDAPFKIGNIDFMPGTMTDQIRLKDTRATLCIKASFEDNADKVSFFYLNEGKYTKIGAPHELRFTLEHFTGARFGLFAFSTKEAGGTATFSNFIYRYE